MNSDSTNVINYYAVDICKNHFDMYYLTDQNDNPMKVIGYRLEYQDKTNDDIIIGKLDNPIMPSENEQEYQSLEEWLEDLDLVISYLKITSVINNPNHPKVGTLNSVRSKFLNSTYTRNFEFTEEGKNLVQGNLLDDGTILKTLHANFNSLTYKKITNEKVY